MRLKYGELLSNFAFTFNLRRYHLDAEWAAASAHNAEREKIVCNYIDGVGNTGPADPRLFDAGDVGGGRGWGGVGKGGWRPEW